MATGCRTLNPFTPLRLERFIALNLYNLRYSKNV